MSYLIVGLVIFLGIHSVRIMAEDWRTSQISRFGMARWKLAYSLVSAIGLGLIVWGYGLCRNEAPNVWVPPPWTGHLVALLTIAAFVLLVAAYIPGSRIKGRIRHPMTLGVALWAIAHLTSSRTFSDVLLFGAFFLWSCLAFRAAWQRDCRSGVAPPAGTLSGDLRVVTIGSFAWGLFASVLHSLLIGVDPF